MEVFEDSKLICKFEYISCEYYSQNGTFFRESNFGKGKIGGIFTLGEATAKEIKIIEDKTETLKVIKSISSVCVLTDRNLFDLMVC